MGALIFLLPIQNYLFLSVLGRKIGVLGSSVLVIINIIIALIVTILTIVNTQEGLSKTLIWEWIKSGEIKSEWIVAEDWLVSIIGIVVIVISLCVHIFSLNYIKNDPIVTKFLGLLGLFTGAIILIVESTTLIELFVGWEIIGVASYLLIGFWSTRLAASNASIQAFLINRIGDWFICLVLGMVYSITGTNDLELINIMIDHELVKTIILIAAIGKSAQLGIHVWLPSSIEGPTPVSALIHAATLVTAGVFLCLRLAPTISSNNYLVFSILGGATVLIAGLSGIVQNDIKRVIAFSTISQIGYIFISLGLGYFSTAFQHLVNHAFFKAILFLSAGSLIHGLSDIQDLRRFGSLRVIIPITYIAILIGSLSLIAFPFFTGFYSKDLILELALAHISIGSLFIYFCGLIGAFLTAYYSTRLLNIVFYNSNTIYSIYNKGHEGSIILILPIIILLFFSVILGYYLKDFTPLDSSELSDAEFTLSGLEKGLPFLITLLGSLLSKLITKNKVNNYINKIYNLIINKFYFENVYNLVLLINALKFGLFSSKIADRGFLEPYWINRLLSKNSELVPSIRLPLASTLSIIIIILIIVIGLFLYFF